MRAGNQIPLMTTPQPLIPPLSAHYPRPISVLDKIPLLAKEERYWPLVPKHHRDIFSRANLTDRGALLYHDSAFRWCRRNSEGFDTECPRLMCVFENSAAYALFSYDGANTGQRHIQPSRFGKLRREQTELNLTGATWLRCERKCQDGSWRRMRFEIEMNELQP